MANNKFMGTFDSESEVLAKIEELKGSGSREEDMFVMARDKDQISMVRGRTDVDYKSSEGGWMDKFMGFLSGDDSTREAFSGMDIDKDESDRYYNEVQNGKILLFVDREFGASYEGQAPYDNQTYGQTGTGTDSGVTDSTSPGYVETGTVARDGLTVDTNTENDEFYNRRDGALSEGESIDQSATGSETAGVGRDSGTGFGLGSPTTDENFSNTDDGKNLSSDRDTYTSSRSGNSDHTEEEKLRLHEERLNVDKENVKTGEVNVSKHVVEEERSVDVPVEREEVYVERRPVDGDITDSNGTGFNENESINIPVTEERVNVSKNDVVSEEIVVGKNKVHDTETVNETVRREEADIDEDSNLSDSTRRQDDRDRF